MQQARSMPTAFAGTTPCLLPLSAHPAGPCFTQLTLPAALLAYPAPVSSPSYVTSTFVMGRPRPGMAVLACVKVFSLYSRTLPSSAPTTTYPSPAAAQYRAAGQCTSLRGGRGGGVARMQHLRRAFCRHSLIMLILAAGRRWGRDGGK